MTERLKQTSREVIINFMDGSTRVVHKFDLHHKPEGVNLDEEIIGRVLATPGAHLEVFHREDDPLGEPKEVEVLNTANIKSIIFPKEICKPL